MKEAIGMIAIFGLIFGLPIWGAFALNWRLHRKYPSAKPFAWGYWIGISSFLAPLMILSSVNQQVPDMTAATKGMIFFGLMIIYAPLGFKAIRRSRSALVWITILSFNPALWIVNYIYFRNRWDELGTNQKEGPISPATKVHGSTSDGTVVDSAQQVQFPTFHAERQSEIERDSPQLANSESTKSNNGKRWTGRLVGTTLIGAMTVGALWVWHFQYQSIRDQREIEHAIELQLALVSNSNNKGWAATLRKKIERANRNPRPIELFELSGLFRQASKAHETHKLVFQSARQAALRQAVREGSNLARIEMAVESQKENGGDFKESLKILDKVRQEVKEGTRAGEPVSMYTYAELKYRGLAVDVDKAGALQLVVRAAQDLPPALKARVLEAAAFGTGIFEGRENSRLAEQLSNSLLDLKYFPVLSPCWANKDDWEEEERCHLEFSNRASLAGDSSYFAEHAVNLVIEHRSLWDALNWFHKLDPSEIEVRFFVPFLLTEVSVGGGVNATVRNLVELWRQSLTKAKAEHKIKRYELGFLAGPGNFVARLVESSGAQSTGVVKAITIYRGLILAMPGHETPDDAVLAMRNNNTWKIYTSPRVIKASENLTNAIIKGEQIDNALQMIDLLDDGVLVR